MRRSVAILGVLSVFAAGCTGSSHSKTARSPAAPGRGGTLRVGVAVEFGRNYDPQVYSGTSNFEELGRCCLLRTLLSYNGQNTSAGGTTLRPDLAAGLPNISPDGLVWTFHVKPGIRYAPPLQHVQIVARDFVRGMEREIAPAPSYLTWFGGLFGDSAGATQRFASFIQGAKEYSEGRTSTISGLEAPNDQTLVVHLTEPNGDVAYEFATPEAAPIPANPFDPGARFGVAEGHDGDYGNYLVGSGPYMIEGSETLDFRQPAIRQAPATGVAPDSITLVRNPSWNPATDSLRLASVDRIVLTAVDQEKATQKIDSGELDMIIDGEAPPGVVAHYSADPALKTRVYETPADSVLFMPMNLALPPFDDVHVRRAVNYAIDKTAVLRTFQKGRQVVATLATHLVPDSLEHNLLLQYDPFGPAHAGNLRAAKAEMAKSKYDSNGEGICDDPKCGDIRFLVRQSTPERIAIARIARSELAAIGIHLRLDVVDDETFFTTFNDPAARLPIALFESNRGLPAAADFMRGSFASDSVTGFGFGGNLSLVGARPAYLRKYGYTVREVPSADERIRDCLPQVFEAQIKCWTALDQYLMEQVVPWVPLAATVIVRVVSARVQNFSFDQANPLLPLPALDRVALTPEAAREAPAPEASPTPGSTSSPAIPGGTYTTTVTRDDLIQAGVDPSDEGGLQENTGKITLTLSRGHWRSTRSSPDFISNPVTTGIFTGSGHRITFVTQTPGINATTVVMRWAFDRGELRFKILDAKFKDDLPWVKGTYESHPWSRGK